MKFFSIVFVVCFCYLNFVTSFMLEDCGTEGNAIKFKDVSVNKHELTANKQIVLDGMIEVLKEIENGTTVSLSMKRVFTKWGKSIPMPLPCVKNVGSCTYQVCEAFHNEEACKKAREIYGHCGCPIPPGTYDGKHLKPIKLDANTYNKLKGTHYVAVATLNDLNKAVLGCVKLDITF